MDPNFSHKVVEVSLISAAAIGLVCHPNKLGSIIGISAATALLFLPTKTTNYWFFRRSYLPSFIAYLVMLVPMNEYYKSGLMTMWITDSFYLATQD